jgi:hypothetical protein
MSKLQNCLSPPTRCEKVIWKKYFIFAPLAGDVVSEQAIRQAEASSCTLKFILSIGDIAQLARACDWQSQGQGFDSPYLHKHRVQINAEPCKHIVYGVSCL